MPTLAVVCVHYHAKFVAPTLRRLDHIAARVPASRTIFVANHDEALVEVTKSLATRNGTCQILRHDNSGMEFGAYQAGADRVLADSDPDWILFANDSFATHHNFATVCLEKLCSEMADIRSVPAIIGQTVTWPRSFQIAGRRTHRFMMTNLFAINRAGMQVLGGRVYRPELEKLVTETGDLADFFAPSVDSVLRDRLQVWLFRTRPGWHWYAAEPLDAKNAAKMARKARSILQEKYLSAALEECAAEFVDLRNLNLWGKLRRKVDDKLFDLAKAI